MITYTYKVDKIQCIVNSNLMDYVKFIYYKIYATKNNITEVLNLYACLPNIEQGPSFIPYNMVTEEEIIAWANDAIGEDYLNGVKLYLEDRINKAINDEIPYEKPLPW